METMENTIESHKELDQTRN